MSEPTQAKLSRRLGIAAFVVALLLLVYVSMLLFANYRSSVRLQGMLFQQIGQEAQRQGRALDFFFKERRSDIANLATAREVSAYFENQALGMSMQYGLRLSLFLIQERFLSAARRITVDGRPVYKRIVLVDGNGTVLVDTAAREGGADSVDGQRFLAPGHTGGAPSVVLDGRQIVVTAAYFFKKRYAGQIVAWLDPSVLRAQLRRQEQPDYERAALVTDTGMILYPLTPEAAFSPPDFGALAGLPAGTPLFYTARGPDRPKQRLAAFRYALSDAPLSLVSMIDRKAVQGRFEPWYLLVGMTVLSFALIGGAVFIFLLNMRAATLAARLEESERRERDIQEKNVQLEMEIAERRRTETALRESEERFRTVVETAQDAIFIKDRELRYRLANPALERLVDVPAERMLGRTDAEIFGDASPGPLCDGDADVLRGSVVERERTVQLGGQQRSIHAIKAPLRTESGEVIGLCGIVRDNTYRKKMEEELLKAEKLESIGILAGGIAHDFNNLLTSIVGNISLAKLSVSPGDDAYRRLDDAERASERTKDLTQQLLTFSRGGTPVRKPSSIAHLIREASRFALRGSSVRCEFSFPRDLWTVEADEGQISQVINNLIINAGQAMPGGGVISIRGANISVGTGDALPLRPGRYVRISVRDEGMGIPAEHLPKIFDPYFTTKQTGSGLGLATVYSIMKKHEGHISVESAAGAGTTFHLYLPATGQPAVTEPAPVDASPPAGTGKVLVMDDEEHIRELLGAILLRLGYTVEYSPNGEDALERYLRAKEAGAPFSAVIMDLTIPGGMGGKQLMALLREYDPAVRAVASSGYSNDPIMAFFRDYGFSGVIAKPYRVNEVAAVLHDVLAPKTA